MRDFTNKIIDTINAETLCIDMDTCDISIEESAKMVVSIQKLLSELRGFIVGYVFPNDAEEIYFFRVLKPEVMSRLLYFNKIYSIELKFPNGSNEEQTEYLTKELESLGYFFNKHIDFYQYYRSQATHLDEHYFLRGKLNMRLGSDSARFDKDPIFSTDYDYKIAKILANEMLRIYLNKRIDRIGKNIRKANSNSHWTASKTAIVELGYSIFAEGSVNRGCADIKEIMERLEVAFNIEIGDYYRTYLAIKARKKDRTLYLTRLEQALLKKMSEEDD